MAKGSPASRDNLIKSHDPGSSQKQVAVQQQQYSILKSSTLWKKKGGNTTKVTPYNHGVTLLDKNESSMLDTNSYPSRPNSDEDQDVCKIQSLIDVQTIDRFGYKRAYSNKAKLKNEAEVAERILGSLAKEASGQETNQ